jgi:hypothetical protein
VEKVNLSSYKSVEKKPSMLSALKSAERRANLVSAKKSTEKKQIVNSDYKSVEKNKIYLSNCKSTEKKTIINAAQNSVKKRCNMPSESKPSIPVIETKSIERKSSIANKKGSFIGRGTSYAISPPKSLISPNRASPMKIFTPQSKNTSEKSPSKDPTSMALEYLQYRNANDKFIAKADDDQDDDETMIQSYDAKSSQKAMSMSYNLVQQKTEEAPEQEEEDNAKEFDHLTQDTSQRELEDLNKKRRSRSNRKGTTPKHAGGKIKKFIIEEEPEEMITIIEN